MKYLFFFIGQPLLLCCVCCKIAIQDFVTGLHKKNKKNLRFHRRVHQRTITRWYFTKSCKKFTGLCHNHWRRHQRTIPVDISQSCKKFTGLCHNHRRVHRQLSWSKIQRHHWRIYAHPEAHACQTCVRLHKYQRIEKSGGIFECFWCAFQLISDGITNGI